MDTTGSLAIAEQLYAALEADNIPRFLELCADDVTLRYPAEGRLPYGGTWKGDGIARFMDVHDAAEEILSFKVRWMAEDGDSVFVLGEFGGRAKPDGREWSTAFVHHLTVTDGLLRQWEAFFDTAAAVDARA